MAREMNLSRSAISRIWRAFGLQPHRQETFKLSSDPPFVDKVRDIVAPYMDPPLKAMVLCVDERAGSRRWIARSPCWPSHRALPSHVPRLHAQWHDYLVRGPWISPPGK